MLKLLIGCLLALIALGIDVLRQIYIELPIKEVKRLARAGHHQAQKLYKAAVYKDELETLLLLLMGLFVAGALVLLAVSLKTWEFFALITIVVWLFSVWKKVPRFTVEEYIAVALSPLFARIIDKISFLLEPISSRLRSADLLPNNIFQVDDLVDLLKKQSKQPDNRISKNELDIAIGGLTFSEKTVQSVMIPRRMIVSVKLSDTVGPILMEELHKSGHSRFPVIGKKSEKVEGILYLKDILSIKRSAKVSEVMKKEIFYVHEEYSLDKVFDAFLKTKHHLFMVVNRFEEIVGVITIEDILEQIIGKQIVDEFDKYEDLKEVANTVAKHEHKKMSTEVIE